MFRLFFNNNNKVTTCSRPIKSHVPGSKREEISNFTMKTLGSGNLRGAVKLPEGEDINEWIASNTVDFFNELNLIWGIICDVGIKAPKTPGSGFPPGFEYRWSVSKYKSPLACSGPQYVDFCLQWIDDEINNENLFPHSSTTPFPKNFMAAVKILYTRMFRIFSIVYSHHFSQLEEVGAVSHVNTSFKHFIFFILEFDLVHQNELDALHDIVEELKSRYHNG